MSVTCVLVVSCRRLWGTCSVSPALLRLYISCRIQIAIDLKLITCRISTTTSSAPRPVSHRCTWDCLHSQGSSFYFECYRWRNKSGYSVRSLLFVLQFDLVLTIACHIQLARKFTRSESHDDAMSPPALLRALCTNLTISVHLGEHHTRFPSLLQFLQ